MKSYPVAFRAVLLAGAASGCLFWHPTAAAAADQPAAGVSELTEVVVTARKREENLQTVPLAVSVQTGQALEKHQITDIYQLQSLTPSLSTQPGISLAGVPSFLIRGIGTAVFGITVESSVGTVIDDVPMARTQLGNVQLYDIDRVEVLRGPQGMLFGKNAAAGLINIVTNRPHLGETEFFSHFQYGNLNTPNDGNNVNVNAGANLPIGDKAAIRLSGFYNYSDGLGENTFNRSQFLGSRLGGFRGQLRVEPTDAVRITVAGDWAKQSGVGEGLQTVRYAPAGGSEQAVLAAAGIIAGPENTAISSNVGFDNGYKVWGTSVKIELDVGGGFMLTNVAGYRQNHLHILYDSDGTQASYFDYTQQPNNSSQYTEELRLTSPAGKRLTYQGGFFYSSVENSSALVFAGKLQGLTTPTGGTVNALAPFAGVCARLVPAAFPNCLGAGFGSDFSAQSKAVFGEGKFDITDALHLTAGARYTHDSMNYRTTILGIAPPTGPVVFDLFALRGIRPVSTDNKKNNVSYRASLDYDISPDVMTYFSYGKGYKGPGFDSTSGAVVNPEIPTNYELGLKSTLLDHRLRLNLALFDETFRGFQVQTLNPANGVSQITNAGSLKSRGVEAEFELVPIEGLTLSGGLTYNSTKYENLLLPCYAGAPAGLGVNQCGVHQFGATSGQAQDVSGNSLAGSPDWTETLTVRYERPVLQGWRGFAQATGYFRSGYFLQANADPQSHVGSSQIYGLSIGAQEESGRLGFSLFVRNLTDVRTPTFIYSSPIAGMDSTPMVGGAVAADRFQQFGTDSFRMIGFSVDYKM